MTNTAEQQMNDAIEFAKKNIVELAKLIVEWKNTSVLGNGKRCLVNDLADMLPKTERSIPLAESIINSICIEMISNSDNKTSFLEQEKPKDLQEKFNTAFNNILEGSTQRYLDPKNSRLSEIETTRIEVLNKNGEWLIDYDTDPKNPRFWYQYDRVYLIFYNKLSLQYEKIQSLMKSLVESQYKMKGVTPCCKWHTHNSPVGSQYKMKGSKFIL